MTARRPLLARIAFFMLWVLVFSMPFEKSIDIPGLGTVSRFAGLLAMAAGVVAVAARNAFRKPTRVHFAFCIFVLWSAATALWSIAPDLSVERTLTYVQLLSLIWLVWEFCTADRHVLSMLDAYVLGTLLPIAQTMQRFLSGQQTYYNRYAIEGFDPNDLALTLALSLPMSYYLSLRHTGLRSWLYRIQIAATAGTILLTGSRGGTLAMAVALILIPLTLRALPSPQRIALGVTGALALAGAIYVVPAASWNRLASFGSEISEGTLNSRTILWGAGWKALGEAPFQGIGSGAYPETTVEAIGRPWAFVPVAHNSFLSVLVETGVVGFSLFVVTLMSILLAATRLPALTSRFWCVLLAVWIVGVSSLTWEYRKPTWLIFALLIAHAASLARAQRPARRWTDFAQAEARLA